MLLLSQDSKMITAKEARNKVTSNIRLEQLESIQREIIWAVKNDRTEVIIATKPAETNLKILSLLGYSYESNNAYTRIYW
jgi:hypothetical protein